MKKTLLIFALIVSISGITRATTNSCSWNIHGIDITCLDLGKGTANCYVVSSSKKDAYVIDPGGNAKAIIAYLRAQHLNVKGYLLTHGHKDHIRALPQMLQSIPATAGIHPDDIPLYQKRMGNSGSFDLLFKDRQTYGSGVLQVTIIHTPGHSPGGVCFYFKQSNVLFTGDTLFKDGVGRTDLDGGSHTELQSSLRTLAKLPSKTTVFPGHGDSTLINKEL